MKLPFLNSSVKWIEEKGGFNGIGENQLSDALNLHCSDICHTRLSRQEAFVYDSPPDQIIKCNNFIFLRYGNTLRQVFMDDDGILNQTAAIYELSKLPTYTDREVILWNNRFFVFPDNIYIGYDVWKTFGENNSLKVALPFINARTFFYTSDASSSAFCDESQNLKVGMKFRLTYDYVSTEYTIKIIETKTALAEDGVSLIEVGKRITLDKDVSNYNSLPAGLKIEYCDPANRPMVNELTVGFNHSVAFSGNKMTITSLDTAYSIPLDEFFKVGQQVEIAGSSVDLNNLSLKITDIKDNTLYFDGAFTAKDEENGTVITVKPIIPKFSHLLITEDRLFGVDNEEKKLHISALNNPSLFYDNASEPKDAWSMNLSEECTGLTLWKDSVICFTENGGFRILGYNATNFGVRQLSLNGIKKGCEKSLSRVGDTLFYCSDKGVMRYSGGSDNAIFHSNLQIRNVKKATNDGVYVYMLTDDRIWVYDTVTSFCWSEDNKKVWDIFNFNSNIYFALHQGLYIAKGEGDAWVNWSFKLPFLPNEKYQRVAPNYLSLTYLNNTDCVINIYYKAFGEAIWKTCGTYQLKDEGSIKLPLPKGYCNGFEIKADGYGMFCPKMWNVNYRRIK